MLVFYDQMLVLRTYLIAWGGRGGRESSDVTHDYFGSTGVRMEWHN